MKGVWPDWAKNKEMRNTKKLLFVVISLAMIFTSAFSVYAFTDTNGSPYEEAIDALAELELVLGTGNNVYGVADNVTRQQMALFIARLASGLTVTDSPNSINTTIFTDLVDSVYNHAISYCYDNDIIIGKGGTIFDPTGDVLVQEAITMAVRTLGYNGLDYPDEYIEKASEAGLLSNLDNLDYETPMLRGEIAQLIFNTLHCESRKGAEGTSFADLYFTPTIVLPQLDYFEITTLEVLEQNYDCSWAKDTDEASYRHVDNVTLFGYTGYVRYEFYNNPDSYLKCRISFNFHIQGERAYVEGNPFEKYAINSTAELSAKEAKNLIETVNMKVSKFIEMPAVSPESFNVKAGAPSDIYEATAKNYARIGYQYNNTGNVWSLDIHTEQCVGCLYGTLEYTVK